MPIITKSHISILIKGNFCLTLFNFLLREIKINSSVFRNNTTLSNKNKNTFVASRTN